MLPVPNVVPRLGRFTAYPSDDVAHAGCSKRAPPGGATLGGVTQLHRFKAFTAALLLTSCGPPTLPICDTAPQLQVSIVDYGFHTEIVIPASQLNGSLALFRALFPAARTISFGFGKANFFTLRDPGFLDFASGIIPGPADIRVIPLRDEPQNLYTTPITRIPLTPAEWSQLESFISASFARTPSGTPIPALGEDGTGGRFFAATSGYSLAYTCNTWTVGALSYSGLHVETGALFAGSAMRQVAHVTGACAPR